MNPEYSKIQIGYALNHAVKSYQEALKKLDYPENKVQWIRQTALAIIELLEKETKEFNSKNTNNPILNNDLVSTTQTALNLILKTMGKIQIKD